MFEEIERKKTPEEKKALAIEVVVALVVCAVIGVVLVWFFGYYGVD